MSQKSATSIISLPKGGGAQKGIGETFSPDLFTGTGNFTVPIALPAGRNGMQPEINLVYSSGNGNSSFGLGWSLSIPGVTRKTSKGIPRYRDYAQDLERRDTFVLSGAEDLFPVAGAPAGATRYRPRTEGLFALIDHYHTGGDNYWKVQSKDGLVSFYGTPRPGEAADDWQDPAAVADPVKRKKNFAWKLTRTQDVFGNHLIYEYDRDTGQDGPHHWDELYLRAIKYVDYTTENGQTGFLISVTFHYEDRPDPSSDYRAGFEIRTRKRCTHIEVHTHADQDRLVRTTRFIYLDQRTKEAQAELARLDTALEADPTNEALKSQRDAARAEWQHLQSGLPLNGSSLLSQVKVVGHDGDLTEELPPLEFGYSKFELEKRNFFPLRGRDLPAKSLGASDHELVDLFGNGLPDIMQMNGTVRYWRNLGNGEFDLPRQMKEVPLGISLADANVQMIDADGDGRIDLMATDNGLPGYYSMKFNPNEPTWDHHSFKRQRVAPSFNLADPEVKLVDLDGDGITDAMRSGNRMECFFNDPKEGWSETRFVERRALDDFPNVNFSDPRVRCSDMCGDGLTDIVLVHDGKVEYWPNLGYGNWGKRVIMRNSPRFPYGYDPRRLLLGDLDGDGVTDLIYVDHGEVTLWINQKGNGWSDPMVIDGTPYTTDMDA
ncbi:MAG: SpvB/TcaC N-terminal domain-containing protein, partial [bacterium]